MIQLLAWAARWHIPLEAIQELQREIGIIPDAEPSPMLGKSEAAVSAEAVLRARRDHGAYSWRNNSGAYLAEEPPSPGTRWGLGNTSKEINAVMKSSDFIGIWPFLIGPQHIGHTVGQFWAREDKAPDWVFTGTKRERAQLNFGELVIKLGGKFSFHTGGEL